MCNVAVSLKKYEAVVEVNRRLEQENADLRKRISFMEKEIAHLKEVNFHAFD